MFRRLSAAAISAAALIALAACGDDADTEAGGSGAASDPKACAEGKTIADGTLTIATGEPAFPPYVIDDKPESGEGFEAAVAMAVAREMGFEAANVTWIRTGFDEAIAPGPKDFDFNLQQYTITEERKAAVTFSDGYYTAAQALVGPASGVGAATSMEAVRGLKLGAAFGTTSLTYAEETIKPTTAVQVYDDNAAAKVALEGGQIDAIVADLPTALFLAAVELTDAAVYGQIEGSGTDEFGMLFAKDNALASCVNGALAKLKESGELGTITTTWMSEWSSAPVIKAG